MGGMLPLPLGQRLSKLKSLRRSLTRRRYRDVLRNRTMTPISHQAKHPAGPSQAKPSLFEHDLLALQRWHGRC
jgi:hypothetical protein